MLTATLRPKRCRNPECKAQFLPARPLQVACSPPCGLAIARAKREKDCARQARAERAADRAKREKLKPRAKWLAECQAIVNRYVRVKALSRGEGCYTCGATPQQKFGGTYDAGHFRSVGSAPHLRFWIPQIKLQCIPCNRHKGGMALAFRRALVRDHGAAWVEELEAMQHVAKFDIDYLRRFKAVIGKRLRRLEARV
jgi:hypothetical protein